MMDCGCPQGECTEDGRKRCPARIPDCASPEDDRAQCLHEEGHEEPHGAQGFGEKSPREANVIWFDRPIKVRVIHPE